MTLIVDALPDPPKRFTHWQRCWAEATVPNYDTSDGCCNLLTKEPSGLCYMHDKQWIRDRAS